MTPKIFYLLTLAAVLNSAGCASSFLPKPIDPPNVFNLTSSTLPAQSKLATRNGGPPTIGPSSTGPTLIISAPHAVGGLNSTHMIYVPRANELAFFAQSQWADTPSAMLMPLIARAVQATGAFKAVLNTPTGALSQFRMDTELVRLEQNFLVKPSQVRFEMRAVIMDTTTRKVIAHREFSANVAAQSDDAYGGVIATQQAVQLVLAEIAVFCAEAVR